MGMYIDDQEHKSQSISEAMIDIQRMSSSMDHISRSMNGLVRLAELNSSITVHSVNKAVTRQSTANTVKDQWSESKADERVSQAIANIDPKAPPSWLESVLQRHTEATLQRCDNLEARMESRLGDLSAQVERLAHAMAPIIAQARGSSGSGGTVSQEQRASRWREQGGFCTIS